ncbi:MAG: hypothetical protein WC523_06900 [Patescibacteria group bacterium]|jgi:hypothetical protein
MKKTIEITDGPSREEMFDGLRLFSERRLIPFRFRVREISDKQTMVAVLVGAIEAVDDGGDDYRASGHSWNLTFSVNRRFVADEIFMIKPEKKEPGVFAKEVNFEFFRGLTEENYLVGEFRKDLISVKAYYSTKTRKGNIIIE